jgi:hypothetical protein
VVAHICTSSLPTNEKLGKESSAAESWGRYAAEPRFQEVWPHYIQVVILITLIGFLLLLLCWIKATRDRVVVAFEVAVATRKSIVLLDSLLSACWVGSRRILAVRRVYTSGARQRGSASYLSSYLTCLNTMALNGCLFAKL